jgi:hypothetical protein
MAGRIVACGLSCCQSALSRIALGGIADRARTLLLILGSVASAESPIISRALDLEADVIVATKPAVAFLGIVAYHARPKLHWLGEPLLFPPSVGEANPSNRKIRLTRTW